MSESVPKELTPEQVGAQQIASGMKLARQMMDENPQLSAQIDQNLEDMNAGKEVSLNQVTTLIDSGNFNMAAAVQRQLIEATKAQAAKEGKDYDWYKQQAEEFLKLHDKDAYTETLRLKNDGRAFEAQVMAGLI